MVVNFFEAISEMPKITAQQDVRINRKTGRVYKGAKTRKLREQLKLLFAKHAPKEPIDYPVELTVMTVYPYRKQDEKKSPELVLMDRKPDADNIAKTIIDSLADALFFTNDSRVVNLRVIKAWGSQPGIGIQVSEASRQTASDTLAQMQKGGSYAD